MQEATSKAALLDGPLCSFRNTAMYLPYLILPATIVAYCALYEKPFAPVGQRKSKRA